MDHRRSVISSIFTVTSLALVMVLAGCDGSKSANTNKPSAYDRILQTKTLRVAYITYPPSFIKDPNTGKYSGIMNDVLQEMAKRLDFKVEYVEETAWGAMIESINSGRVDLVCTGLWPTAGRGKLVDFTDPVYFSPIRTYVRVGTTSFDGNLSAINSKGVKIAAIDGEMTSIIAQSDYPNATVQSYPQNTDIAQMLQEVQDGKAEVTFVESAVAADFSQKHPGVITEVKNVNPVRVFPNVMMVSKSEPKLLSALNAAMNEVADAGVMDRIVLSYSKTPGVFLLRAKPYRLEP